MNLIVIENNRITLASPSIYVVKDGVHTGTSTSLGRNTTEQHALEIAREYQAHYGGAIVNLYHSHPTWKEYKELIETLTAYYTEPTPELAAKYSQIKHLMKG